MTSRSNEIGRFVIDIDGCLKSTDLMALAAEDIRRLCRSSCDADQIFWEIYGELVPLGPGDHVKLSEESVAFFQTRAADSPYTGAFLRRNTRSPLSLAA